RGSQSRDRRERDAVVLARAAERRATLGDRLAPRQFRRSAKADHAMNRQRAVDVAFVGIVTLVGAWLRLRQLGVPCFWLDEIIHYDGATGAMKQSLWQWLAISQAENGPLYYATQLAGRLFLPMEA